MAIRPIIFGLILTLLAGCSSAPPAEPPKADVTLQPWYAETVSRLTALSKEAGEAAKSGKPALASSKITEAQPLITKALSPPKPTLEAMEAVSDLDQLYAQMLLSNRHVGWARLQFQKNQARWSAWKPVTPDSERRRKEAETGIAECDRALAK